MKTYEEWKQHSTVVEIAWRCIYQIDLSIIALIHRIEIGGAFGLLAKCDLRYAADDGVFAIPLARLGGCVSENPHPADINLMGPANIKGVLMTARRYSARNACDMGFLARALPKDDLDAYVTDPGLKDFGKRTDFCENLQRNGATSFRGSHLMVMPCTGESPPSGGI